MNIGVHQQFRGLAEAVYDASVNGTNTFQIFIRNNRNCKIRSFTDYDYRQFNHDVLNSDVERYVVHASYALNPASNDEGIVERTTNIIREDMEILSHLARKKCYVLHPGAYKDTERLSAVERLATLLHDLQDTYKGTKICIETMAGQGSQIMARNDEIFYLYKLCRDIPEFSLCVDTCHMFAAGLNPSTLDFMLEKMGPEILGVVHVNGSMSPYGSHVDRHSNLDEGHLSWDTESAYSHLAYLDVLLDKGDYIRQNVPFILETPIAGMDHDLTMLSTFLESR